ncbi:MAG TPA: FmdB family transcriptional regulator [Treponema sp.]|nr:FmdB family transcriptional regulator [Treponema sp.]
MPTYEYACDSCGHHFDVVQKMADKRLEDCPECGEKLRQVLSGGLGIIFKGSGFYVNDSAKKKPTAKTAEKAAPKKAAVPQTGSTD